MDNADLMIKVKGNVVIIKKADDLEGGELLIASIDALGGLLETTYLTDELVGEMFKSLIIRLGTELVRDGKTNASKISHVIERALKSLLKDLDLIMTEEADEIIKAKKETISVVDKEV